MKPIILAHRGWWKTVEEQNTTKAFTEALNRGWGIELDVRDHMGKLVVAHDPPVDEFVNPILFQYVLDIVGSRPNPVAVNVKSCGLAPWFAALKPPKNWFFFDMAFHDGAEYEKLGLPKDRIIRSSELFGNPHLPGWEQLKTVDYSFSVHLLTDFPEEAEEFFT